MAPSFEKLLIHIVFSTSLQHPVRRCPWFIRLALLALFLPITFFLMCHIFNSGFWRHFSDLTGLWQVAFVFVAFVVPITALLIVFVKGWWRIAFVLHMISLMSLIFVDPSRDLMKKNHRTLDFNVHKNFCVGTEVYCNGILLGTVPMSISVDDLLKKVPRWQPPEQIHYREDASPHYRWIPWDGFIPERHKERRNLDPKRNIRELDAQCEFWWNFRYKGATSIGGYREIDIVTGSIASMRIAARRYREIDRYARNDVLFSYIMPNMFFVYYPAKYPLFDIIWAALVESDYNPSEDWLGYVAEHWELLEEHFMVGDQPYRPRLEPVLDAIARRCYGLSHSPTAEECDFAIGQILEENRIKGVFSVWCGRSSRLHFGKEIFGDSYICRDPLVERAIRQLGPNCKEPLRRRRHATEFGGHESDVRDREALAYLWGQYPFPDCFDESVRYYARHDQGFKELMSFDDPRLIPLLQTILRERKHAWEDHVSNVQLKCAFLVFIDNPILEPIIRNYITGNTKSFRNQNQILYDVLYDFVACRIRRPAYAEHTEARKSLIDWIESFPLLDDAYKRDLVSLATQGFPQQFVPLDSSGPSEFPKNYRELYEEIISGAIGPDDLPEPGTMMENKPLTINHL